METIGDRIALIIKKNGLKKIQFAKKLGIDQSYVSKLLKGEKFKPSDALIKSICREFHINEDWLRNGTGAMNAPEPVSDALDAILDEYGLPRELSGLFIRYGNLPEESRAAIREWLRGWILETAEQIRDFPETEDERLERETREEAEEYYRLRLEERKAIRDSEAKQAGTPRNSDSYGDTGGVA